MFLDADHREAGDVVPDSFPGTLVIEPNKNKDPFLHANYREYGQNGNEEFEYFVKKLLAEINPGRTGFKRNSTRRKISECFTPSDEAFALIVLDNELHVWDQQIAKKKETGAKGNELRFPKKYCKGCATETNGWSKKGISFFHLLCMEIEKAREEKGSSEDLYMEKFKGGAEANEQTNAHVQDDSDDDFEVHCPYTSKLTDLGN